MVNQIEAAYESPSDDAITATDNADVKKIYDQVVQAGITDGLSAKLQQWGDDWTASFQKNGFATMLCPGWMVGVIEGNAKGVKGWDVANTFPGGGGNWGGSYLTVPKQSAHPKEAQELAAWLTAPEQQIKAFKKVGAFPSQKQALESPDLLSFTVAVLQQRADRPDLRRPRQGRHHRRRTRAPTTSRSTTRCSRP